MDEEEKESLVADLESLKSMKHVLSNVLQLIQFVHSEVETLTENAGILLELETALYQEQKKHANMEKQLQ